MAQSIFFLAACLSFLYFFYRERRLDIYLIATASGLLFFAAGFLGAIQGPSDYPTLPVCPLMYGSFAAFLIATTLTAMFADLHTSNRDWRASRRAPTPKGIALGVTALWMVSVVYLVFRFPALVFSGSKSDLLEKAGVLQLIALSLSTLAATCVFSSRLRGRSLLTAIILVFSLVAGSRTSGAIAGIAILLIYGRTTRPIALFRKKPLLLPLAVISALFVASSLKTVYSVWRLYGVHGVMMVVTTEPITKTAASGAEFLSTQYIFADIIDSGFRTDGGHVLRGPLGILPIPRGLYTQNSDEFNEAFQSKLYPDIEYGMAYNPFAEMYAAAGIAGVLAFIVLCQVVFYFIDVSLQSERSANWLPILGITGALLGFYIHRNSIAVTFAMIRNVLYPYILVLWLVRPREELRGSEASRSKTLGRCRRHQSAVNGTRKGRSSWGR